MWDTVNRNARNAAVLENFLPLFQELKHIEKHIEYKIQNSIDKSELKLYDMQMLKRHHKHKLLPKPNRSSFSANQRYHFKV